MATPRLSFSAEFSAKSGGTKSSLNKQFTAARAALDALDLEALRFAVEDLSRTFGEEEYPRGKAWGAELGALSGSRLEELRKGLDEKDRAALAEAERVADLAREALLANPLLDFDEILFVKRGVKNLGLPSNWQGNSDLKNKPFDNEIALLSLAKTNLTTTPYFETRTIFRPSGERYVGDVDLHFDGERILFSMPSEKGPWRIYEMRLDGDGDAEPVVLPLINEPDVHNYDACYLPDDNLIFTSSAPFIGVPCVKGNSKVANLYRWNRDGGAIRRLTFDQDHNWCPTVLANGRVLYLRWEYSDIPHYVSRILFHMNPDGTGQMEYYGSNSYWPNSMFYARPVPNHPTKFVAVVSGHHDTKRMGQLVLFDPSHGRHEADGAIQRIPGRGKKIEPIIRDGLVKGAWPMYLHPYPLSDKYFLVACQPDKKAEWGLYLVDIFDNRTLLKEIPGYALLEPIPLRKTLRPPVVPTKVEPERRDAVVYLADVYVGPGLTGIPRGTVKKLRLFTYHFAYHGMGGQINRVGLDGPWDVKRILGTVPVHPDGSALFRVPANTPISVQPLDAEGKALQLMRSWMTAMPGETVSCVGCHERQNSGPPSRNSMALQYKPADIEPWYGPSRGFSFTREVQPVLDHYCVSCHDGGTGPDDIEKPDFRPAAPVHPPAPKDAYRTGTKFTPSYMALRSYVRATIESDMHLLTPCDFHADTTELVQTLRQGHHGVRLNAEAWDRLVTWIDLGAPAHGSWNEVVGSEIVTRPRERRLAMMRRYANLDRDPETEPDLPKPQFPKAASSKRNHHSEKKPRRGLKRVAGGDRRESPETDKTSTIPPSPVKRTIDLGGGTLLDLVQIPAARNVANASRNAVGRPFWMGTFEITNEQYARFDPSHDSRLEHGDFLQFSIEERGFPLNAPRQPVTRVSWNRAEAFCRWLSERTGETFSLPTETQWEHAARAKTHTALWFGEPGADFSSFANLADLSHLRVGNYEPWKLPHGAIYPSRPAVSEFDDGHRVSAPVGSFKANPWGLYDMHGNVWEWTRTAVTTAGENDSDTRNAFAPPGSRVVRGGSWQDRPKRATLRSRLAYPPHQPVFNVGFRVVCE